METRKCLAHNFDLSRGVPKSECPICQLESKVAENPALRVRIMDLEDTLRAVLPTLKEGAVSGMVPFQECKYNYAMACRTLGVEPKL